MTPQLGDAMSLQRHGLGLLATGVSLPFVVFAVELSILQAPTWLPSAALVAWIVWFIYWAASGGVPPRFG